MTRTGPRLALLLGLALVRCDAAPRDPGTAAVTPRAFLLLDPPQLAIGQVGLLERVAVTPPGSRVAFGPAPAVEGLEVLAEEALPTREEASRWVHRARLRVRARAVGQLVWPGGEVRVEKPDGSVEGLPFEPLPIPVASVLSEFPDRMTPFGVELPEGSGEPAAGPVLLPWLAGAASGALAALGLVALASRRRARGGASGAALHGPRAPWVQARRELARARAAADRDPLRASHLATAALRRYVARRFRAATEACTTQELEALVPPLGATTRWPVFLELLRGFDAFRFRPPDPQRPDPDPGLAERVRELLRRADAFVEDTLPPESRDGSPP